MNDYITLAKELIMQFGLYETTICVAIVVTLWRLPNIINAITEYKKINRRK